MANNWTHSINRNISCVCIPLFGSAASPARTRRDSPHPNVNLGELQRECAAIMSLPGQHSTTLSLIMDTSSCGSGSTILGFALRAAAELNTLGLPPSAFVVSTNISASTNIISGEDGTYASAVVSTNVTGSTDVIFGEIVALHIVPIVYLILDAGPLHAAALTPLSVLTILTSGPIAGAVRGAGAARLHRPVGLLWRDTHPDGEL